MTSLAETTGRDQVTVTIRHPRASLLAETGRGVARTRNDILSGDWSALADLCADEAAGAKILDHAGASDALKAAAERSGFSFPSADVVRAEVRERVEDGSYSLIGTEGHITGALDLWTRLLCGQWREVDWWCSLGSETHAARDWDGATLDNLRQALCRTRSPVQSGVYRPLGADEFPEFAAASIGIAQGVEPARLAYHAYKLLGGGAAGGPTFSLPEGPVVVEVDGRVVDRIRQYR